MTSIENKLNNRCKRVCFGLCRSESIIHSSLNWRNKAGKTLRNDSLKMNRLTTIEFAHTAFFLFKKFKRKMVLPGSWYNREGTVHGYRRALLVTLRWKVVKIFAFGCVCPSIVFHQNDILVSNCRWPHLVEHVIFFFFFTLSVQTFATSICSFIFQPPEAC